MRFSEREGFQLVSTALQVDGMDAALRNGLWSVTHALFFEGKTQFRLRDHEALCHLGTRLWFGHYKLPLDQMPGSVGGVSQHIRDWWMRPAEWWQVYDLVEFLVEEYQDEEVTSTARELYNRVLEQERSAFRFVGLSLTRLTSAEEVAAVERTLEKTTQMSGVRHHLLRALELLGDRSSPDYPNSMKEAISAVESVCRRLSGKQNATLADGFDALERAGVPLHGALVKGFKAIYGYSSDADGIRHAALDVPSVGVEDATYFLVSCSAFVGYLVAKAAEGNLPLTDPGVPLRATDPA